MNQWDRIWKNKNVEIAAVEDKFKMFCNLKKADGFDTQEIPDYFEGFWQSWFEMADTIERICDGTLNSVYEVGCGSGVNLYMFSNMKNIKKLGGMDYSENLIRIAKDIFPSANLLCDEALNCPVQEKYDLVLADSVFQYFYDVEYGMRVLEKMWEKANKVVVITEVHDERRKEEHLKFRRQAVENYDEKYSGLDKTFYTVDMFEKFAEKVNAGCLIKKPTNTAYWNNEFVFDCYIYKK